ncbi:mycothiol transferase [Streptomyces avermitilis]
MHMVEEYARRDGRADLLRERIDGAIGVCRGGLRFRRSAAC